MPISITPNSVHQTLQDTIFLLSNSSSRSIAWNSGKANSVGAHTKLQIQQLQILVPSTAGTSGPGYKVSNIADKIADKMTEQQQIGEKLTPGRSMGLDKQIDPFTVFDAMLTSRQMCEKFV